MIDDDPRAGGEPLALALRWSRAGRGVAVATMVGTWGSSPCPVGSQLMVDESGEFAGSVSGGCIEAAVVQAALEVIAGGRPPLLDFGVSDERAWSLGLACGGQVGVYVARVATQPPAIRRDLIEAVLAARAACRAVVLVTDLASGSQSLVDEGGEARGAVLGTRLRASLRETVTAQRSGRLGSPFEGYFAHLLLPRPRLFMVGAVHIAQLLAAMALLAGWEVTVIDPRSGFANPGRFPGVKIDGRWPGVALNDLSPDRRTAIAVLSHDPKIDDPALIAALQSTAFYVGALGSRRTHAKRVERLQAGGVAATEVARIHAPIGLDLGARGAAEIAVSVLAEITAIWRRQGSA